MTAIAGVIDNGKVYIGGDSAGTGGKCIETRKDPKVFIIDEFIFGYTSSFRMGQLIQYMFKPPEVYSDQTEMEYMVTLFVPAIKKCLSEGGYQRTKDGEDFGGTFLVGYKGELYEIQNDYQVSRVIHNYNACGCGFDLILGSLHTTEPFEFTPTERITMALEAASEFSSAVCGPFTILSV